MLYAEKENAGDERFIWVFTAGDYEEGDDCPGLMLYGSA